MCSSDLILGFPVTIIPEFDNIGMEAVPATTLFNSDLFDGTSVNDFLGYNPRYWPWKSKIDRVHGAFTIDNTQMMPQ